jgi:hypothetical protein
VKIRITVANGKYPLTCECATIGEAYACIDALRTGLLHDIPIDMDEIMSILVQMKDGGCLEFNTHRYAIEKLKA